VEVDRLVPASLPAKFRERIARAAGGNPLFVTEMVAMAEGTDGEVTVPPTLRALLTARLDQVEAAERRVLERGAVEGEIFHRGAVQALGADEPQVTARLAALVRRELVRPERAQIPGEDGFRFRHLLIRDAAYEALPKSARADLHERFAGWLEEQGHALVELDEVLGFHLARAVGYRAELGHPDAVLAEKAGQRLAAAGRRALWRDDNRTAAVLLERALALIRPLRLDVNLELDLAEAQQAPQAKMAIAGQAAQRAQEVGDRAAEALARAVVARTQLEFSSAASAVDDLERLAREALDLLGPGADAAACGRAWYVLSEAANYRGRFEERALAAEQALRCFERAGAHHFELAGLPWALVYGPRPADEALETLDSFLERSPAPYGHLCRSQLLAMLDRFDEAWERALAIAERLREVSGRADIDLALGEMAAAAGEHKLAVPHLQRGCETLKRLGQTAELSSYAPLLGRSLCELGLHELAEPWAQLGCELADERDNTAQASWRQAQACIHAHRGERGEAERLARESVSILEETDALNMQGDAYTDLADVLSQAGKSREARAALEEAIDCYRRKKNVARVRQVTPRL
jgi:tetratricopeptide (TPR) repeat protein